MKGDLPPQDEATRTLHESAGKLVQQQQTKEQGAQPGTSHTEFKPVTIQQQKRTALRPTYF